MDARLGLANELEGPANPAYIIDDLSPSQSLTKDVLLRLHPAVWMSKDYGSRGEQTAPDVLSAVRASSASARIDYGQPRNILNGHLLEPHLSVVHEVGEKVGVDSACLPETLYLCTVAGGIIDRLLCRSVDKAGLRDD